ncbi:recombinase family protein [Mycobacterium sp. 1164985.4]|uniref:recombinase family protein n=1 Tax=Mycobacterium sp. 1164985.4 TaxID=1834069 RepID=UPI000801C2AF|nr:recombinase family protein [Mycobacterium sp. 1164985.4]OBK78339.1 serine recombinase [Mycobacterium sp. 1164985.4]
MKAAIYLRQSLDREDNQLAIDRQREDCERLCATKGWEPVPYVDNDTSASSGKRRDAYEEMLTDIRTGAIGAVVAWDLDRLHRRPVELEAFIALADERHLALATVSGDCDLSTEQGRLVARLKGAVARHEIEQKSKRQRRAGRQKAERGRPKWKRAFGYLPYTGTKEDDVGKRSLDPVTAPLVEQAYASILCGGSISEIARAWNAAGHYGLTGSPWMASTMSLFLRSPRNANLRSYGGEIVGKGTWPPLVDETTWRAAQSVLNSPGRAPGRKSVRRHLLTGVLGCGKCGGHLSGVQVYRSKAIVYQCKSCRGVSVRAEHVEPLLFGIVAGRLADDDAVDLLRAEEHDEATAERLRLEKIALTTRLDDIATDYAEGLLTGQQAKLATDVVMGKLETIEAAQTDQAKLRVLDGIPLGEAEVADAVAALSPDRYRGVLDLLVRVTVMPVGKGHRVGGARFDPDRVDVAWR